VRFADGRLTAQSRRADGTKTEIANRALDELRTQDIRVSVTTGDGIRRAFLISGYETVTADTIGPAQNMFAAQLPAQIARNGVVVQTDTYTRTTGARVSGRAPLERTSCLFVRGRRADGTEGWFIVDWAASGSVVARSFVPAGQEIREQSMTEHSAGGTRKLPDSPGGATGTIPGVAGGTIFPSLDFGDIRFTGAEVTVLEQMPEGFGRPIVGIIGLDLLRRCDRMSLDLPQDSATGTLELASGPGAGAPAAETPFSIVSGHLLVRGALDGTPAHWILDTGSARTVVDTAGVPALAVASAGVGTLRGLGGPAMATEARHAGSLSVGALAHRDVDCQVAPLAVFPELREPGYALGVLGLADIARCRRVEVDFTRGVVRWFR
jgi:hypothetical protein